MEQMILSKNIKQTNKQTKEPDHGQEEKTGFPRGKGERVGWMGILRVFWVQTVIFGMDGQWDPTVQHREMCVVGSLCGTIEFDETL